MSAGPARALLLGMTLLAACAKEPHSVLQSAPGCYAMVYGAWSRQGDGAPPNMIALDTVKPEGPLVPWSIDPRRARPNVPQTRTPPNPAVWYIDTAQVLHVLWTTGYSGYGIMLTRQADGTLTGRMEAFTDAHSVVVLPRPHATVRARHIPCSTAGL